MSSRYDFSVLLSKAEQEILRQPEKWRWISNLVPSDVQPLKRPRHLSWSRQSHGHALPNRELCLCLSGTIIMTLRDAVYTVSPGTVILFDAGDWHDRDAATYQRDFHHLWIHIPSRHIVVSNLWRMDAEGRGQNTELKFTSAHMAELISDIWDRCAQKKDPSIEWAFLKSAITFLLFESASDRTQIELPSSHQQVVDSICDYINKHVDKDLSLSRLAQISGYSPYFFHRIFCRYRQMPLHRYVTEARVKRAKELLQAGQSVTAVSEQVGIMPQSYFSSFFQKHTRFSPSKWREMHMVVKNKESKKA